MRKVFSLFALIFISGLLAKAQIINLTTATGEVLREKRYVGYEGSPFFIDEWNPGTIVTKNGQEYTDFKLRYNMYEDIVEIVKDSKAYLLKRNMISEFVITDIPSFAEKTYRFTNRIPGNGENQYYQLLYDGDIKLIIDHNIELITINSKGYNTSTRANKFVHTQNYYLYSDSIGLKEFKNKKKSFLKILDKNKQDELSRYISSANLKLKREKDLIEAVRYLDNLNE